jgi:hypothetical protein
MVRVGGVAAVARFDVVGNVPEIFRIAGHAGLPDVIWIDWSKDKC